MRKHFYVALFVTAMAISGCGFQRGEHVVNSVSTVAVTNTDGYFTVLSGHPTGRQSGPAIPLLYFLELTDRIETAGFHLGSNHGAYHSILDHKWETTDGEVAFVVDWNRRTDTVHIGDQLYDRADGIIFVARARNDGSIESVQLECGARAPDRDAVLVEIRRHFSDVEAIAGLELHDS